MRRDLNESGIERQLLNVREEADRELELEHQRLFKDEPDVISGEEKTKSRKISIIEQLENENRDLKSQLRKFEFDSAGEIA